MKSMFFVLLVHESVMLSIWLAFPDTGDVAVLAYAPVAPTPPISHPTEFVGPGFEYISYAKANEFGVVGRLLTP
jgi:hypothetical protein